MNADGSDILVMNPYLRSSVVSSILIDGSGARKEYSAIPSDEPTLKKVYLWEIHEIVDGYIKLYHEPEYICHIPEFVKEGDLVIRGVGAPYDIMIQRGVDEAIILEVIYHMELGDCAFVKQSDGSWTFAYFQGIYWRGENDKGPFGKRLWPHLQLMTQP